MSHGMDFAEAGRTYTLLTVGDGLVTQIPALIISVAAGLLVTKAGVDGAADKALAKQLASYPVALGVVSACAFGVGVLPGMPLIPFWVLAFAAGLLAWRLRQANRVAADGGDGRRRRQRRRWKKHQPRRWRWTMCASSWALRCCR